MIFSGQSFGEQAGSTSAAAMPSAECLMVDIKAHAGNAGNVYIGRAGEVTKPGGTTDFTSGYPIAAGEEKRFWVPSGNLDYLGYICDNAGDSFSYLIHK